MITRKRRVSFAKLIGRRGTRGSDSLDHDLAAQNKMFRDLTVGVGCGSGGQGFSWAPAAAGTRRDRGPVAARGEKLVGVRQDGAPGVKSTGNWVREVRHNTRDRSEASMEFGKALRIGVTAAAALRGNLAGVHALDCFGAQIHEQKGRGACAWQGQHFAELVRG